MPASAEQTTFPSRTPPGELHGDTVFPLWKTVAQQLPLHREDKDLPREALGSTAKSARRLGQGRGNWGGCRGWETGVSGKGRKEPVAKQARPDHGLQDPEGDTRVRGTQLGRGCSDLSVQWEGEQGRLPFNHRTPPPVSTCQEGIPASGGRG